MNKLEKIILREIKAKGPLTFARFMEMALYYPELGYYTRRGAKIGAAGDFYTSSDVHPAFGQMLARQFAQMWAQLGGPDRWELVEYGAGTGRLAAHVLNFLREQHPAAAKGLRYFIIEISPALIAGQKKELEKLPFEIIWLKNAGELSGRVTGCLFANELVDSFPVHRVRQTAGGLKEIYVDCFDGGNSFFREVEGPLSTPLLQAYFEAEGVVLEPGQAAEVNLAARDWLREAAACLHQGYLLTIDYGAPAPELYAPFRPDGTLRCFFQHRLNADPFQHVGEQDLTASVNFSALMRWGEQFGLTTIELLSQAKFLLRLGIFDLLPKTPEYSFDPEKLKTTLAIKKLIMPEGMGEVFQVLIQKKG